VKRFDEPRLPIRWPAVRLAGPRDDPSVALLQHDLNREFDEPVPEPDVLVSLLGESLDCYVEEVYVVPARRRCGIGTALMKAALGHARDRRAGYAYLGAGAEAVGARALYEGLGFGHRGSHASGPVNYCFYEREL
jgi:GNAT superfamily N-acetyltransferase